MHEDVTGPADASRGLVSIFDIFGYFNQTLQGADILATADSQLKYKLFMPDWFDGYPVPAEWLVLSPSNLDVSRPRSLMTAWQVPARH